MTSHINVTPAEALAAKTDPVAAFRSAPAGSAAKQAGVGQRQHAGDRDPDSHSPRLTLVSELESLDEVRPADSPYHRLSKQTRARIEQFPLAGLEVAPIGYRDEFQCFESKNGRFTVRSWAWCLSHSGQPHCDVRMVFINGSKNNIINTWVFPYQPNNDPVFAAELIAMGEQPRLTFMDIQTPAMPPEAHQAIANAAAQVRSRYGDLRIAEQPPEWAVEATSGQYLFTRQLPGSWFGRICHAYLELLECYLGLIRPDHERQTRRTMDPEALQTLHRYQIHHMHNSPGEVFLGKVFGKEWTESFLNEFLFCLPGDIA